MNVKTLLAKLLHAVGYSTSEAVVGWWIDGKPIYRKVLSGTSASGVTTVSIGSLNIDTIIKGDIIIHNTTNNTYVLCSYVQDMTTDKFNWYVSADKSSLYLRSGTNYAFGQYYIILEFTKV